VADLKSLEAGVPKIRPSSTAVFSIARNGTTTFLSVPRVRPASALLARNVLI
jgi:hypothetical protein